MTGEFLTNFKTFTNLYILLRNRKNRDSRKKVRICLVKSV